MLLFRERAATTVTIAALIAGAVATSWIYLNGISSPHRLRSAQCPTLRSQPSRRPYRLLSDGRRSHADASQPPPHLNSRQEAAKE